MWYVVAVRSVGRSSEEKIHEIWRKGVEEGGPLKIKMLTKGKFFVHYTRLNNRLQNFAIIVVKQ